MAILILVVLSNIIGLFNSSKKSSFTSGNSTCLNNPFGDDYKYCFGYYENSYSCQSGGVLNGQTCTYTIEKECK